MADSEPKVYKLSEKDGFYAGGRTSVAFIILFALLGVNPLLCVILGLIAGAAARQISSYWNAEEVKGATPVSTEEQEPVMHPVNRWFSSIRPMVFRPRRRPPRLGDREYRESRRLRSRDDSL